MDIVEIFILVALIFSNNKKAKQKEQNVVLWSVLTVITYFIFYIIGMVVVMSFFCKGVVDVSLAVNNNISNINARSQQLAQQWEQAITDKPVRELLVFLIGFGGCLLIRYILDRMPDKKKPEVHWMDKMGE
jgi:amino acid permease